MDHLIIKTKLSEAVVSTGCTKKTLLFALPFALLSSGSLFAAPPIAYGGWTVTDGVIDTSSSCSAAGVTCEEMVPSSIVDDYQEVGFKYEKVTYDGTSFFRLILTEQEKPDPNAPTVTPPPPPLTLNSSSSELAFSNETFSPFSIINEGIAQGVATKQTVREDNKGFYTESEIQSGNMRGLYTTTAEEMFNTKLSQTLTGGTDFNSTFDFINYTAFSTDSTSNNPDTSTVIGKKMNITQALLVGESGDLSKKQKFVNSQVSGYAGNTTLSFYWQPGPDFTLKPKFMTNGTQYNIGADLTTAGSLIMPNTVNGKRVSPATNTTVGWAAGQDVSTTWIAQSNNDTTSAGAAAFNYQQVKNNTTNVEAISMEVNILEVIPAVTTDPFAWDVTNFGVAPTL